MRNVHTRGIRGGGGDKPSEEGAREGLDKYLTPDFSGKIWTI